MSEETNYTKKFEKELGCRLDVFLKALRNGIWIKKELNVSKEYRQKEPYSVMPIFDEEEKEWYLLYDEHAFGNTGCENAHIFWENVKVKDFGISWGLLRKDLKNKSELI